MSFPSINTSGRLTGSLAKTGNQAYNGRLSAARRPADAYRFAGIAADIDTLHFQNREIRGCRQKTHLQNIIFPFSLPGSAASGFSATTISVFQDGLYPLRCNCRLGNGCYHLGEVLHWRKELIHATTEKRLMNPLSLHL